MTKWISVKERLPESNKIVPFFSEGEIYFGKADYYGFHVPNFYDDSDLIRFECVTHWAEIEPPEVE